MQALRILFAGASRPAALIDGQKVVEVHVRALPQRFLVSVIECAEHQTELVELCSYIKAESAEEAGGEPAHPEIPAPAGYVNVPRGFTDNLKDESVAALYELAKELNFQRAADWAKGRMAAQQLVAPLHELALAQALPIVERVMQPLMKRLDALSSSTPSAPSSSAAAAKTS